MEELLESIRAAVSATATAEQKTAGAQACRAILAALDAQPGLPIAMPGAPASPLAGIDPTQGLDLLIARLRAALPGEAADKGSASAPEGRGVRFSLVSPPPGVPWKKR